jgi:hypothetical protein
MEAMKPRELEQESAARPLDGGEAVEAASEAGFKATARLHQSLHPGGRRAFGPTFRFPPVSPGTSALNQT